MFASCGEGTQMDPNLSYLVGVRAVTDLKLNIIWQWSNIQQGGLLDEH
jgi:hypothetical protein